MDETQWDIQEIKHSKKKQLVLYNLVMLLFFMLIVYLSENGKLFLLFGGICVLLWIVVAVALYTLKTGRPVGTKASRRVQEFDRNRSGEKRWKYQQIAEVVFMSVLSVIVTTLGFMKGFNSVRLDFPMDAFPFIGVWVGYNIGEIIRMKNL